VTKTALHGFTLIELLAAMAIFALLAVMMYGGTQWIMLEREIILERQDELQDLQRTVMLLNNDFSQTQLRPVRDELGRGIAAALLAEPGSDYIVELSHDGWRNPAGMPRGTLQRVQYRLEEVEDTGFEDQDSFADDDEERLVLVREYWPVMDRPLGMEGRVEELLTGITEFEIEYMDESQEWQPTWPPLSAVSEDPFGLPLAVRYRLQPRSFGEIQRLVEIPRRMTYSDNLA